MTKFISIVALLLGAVAANAQSGVVCSADLESDTPLFATALHNIYSFGYVRDALAQLRQSHPGAEFCVSGMALSRNIYQYPKYYVQVSARVGGKSVHEMRLLFQDASTQALDNVGDKPWVGLPAAQSEQALVDYVKSLSLTKSSPVAKFDARAVAEKSATYAAGAADVDQATFGVMPVGMADGREYYVVSWLTKPGANPFASYTMLKGVLVVHDPETGEVWTSENLWLTSSLAIPLENLLEQNWVADAGRTGALLK
jgi:hypothetical protein